MKGVHFSKAGEAHWKQLLSYFSASRKNGWGIFLSFAEAPSSQDHIVDRVETWQQTDVTT